MKAKVYVSPKKAVLDPQGKVVEQGLLSLGYGGVEEVRVGKFIELELGDIPEDKATEMVDEMCQRFLANPIIEDYRFEVSGED